MNAPQQQLQNQLVWLMSDAFGLNRHGFETAPAIRAAVATWTHGYPDVATDIVARACDCSHAHARGLLEQAGG